MDVCSGCGRISLRDPVLSPAERPSAGGDPEVHGRDPRCQGCGVAHPRLAVAERPDDVYAVAIAATFQCRSCGQLSPLDGLDLDGAVTCLACGLQQAFDRGAWTEALGHAWAVGDLSGPSPEGRSRDKKWSIAAVNPFTEIGVRSISSVHAQAETRVEDGQVIPRTLRVEVSPGVPVCCGAPVTLTLRGPEATTSCERCGKSHTYTLPPGAARFCAGLVGTLGSGNEAGARDVAVVMEGGLQVLRCPSCAAPLDGLRAISSCRFCGAAVRMPVRGTGTAPPPETWWFLFRGASARREALLKAEGGEQLAIEEPPTRTDRDLLGMLLEWVPGLLLPLGALGVAGVVYALATGLVRIPIRLG